MADDERPESGNDDPSLELPSLKSALGFGRKRGKKAEPPAAVSAGEESTPGEPLPPIEPVEPAIPAPETPPAPPSPEPGRPAAPGVAAQPDLSVPPAAPGPETTPGPIGLPEIRSDVADPTAALPVAARAEPSAASEPRTRRSLPRFQIHLPGPVVALVTGAIVGLALVGLTSASLHLCSAVRGTSSCGKPGYLLLLVITVAMVLLGSVLLRLAGVDAAGSTSFLGVGLLVVIILLALLPVIFHWWMAIVVPLVAMLTYAGAWWLTTTYVEPGERVR
jgi:hypothetical protein